MPTQTHFVNRLTIKTKLRLAFLTLATLFALFSWLAMDRIGAVNDKSSEIKTSWLPSVVVINAINSAVSNLRITEALHVLSDNAAEMADYDKQLENLIQQIAQLRIQYGPLITSERERATNDKFFSKYEEYLASLRKSTEHSRKNERELSIPQLNQGSTLFKEMIAELVQLVEINNQGAINASNEGGKIFHLSRKILLGATVGVFVLAIVLMIIFEKMISHPLSQLTEIIQKLATGDFSTKHTLQHRNDEIGQIAQAISAITQTLEALINDSGELINAAKAGSLSARIESNRHPGEFGVIILGMNQLLEVLNRPLVEIAEVMQQLALGNLKGRIEGAYEGDLRALKANINRSLDALAVLLTELGEVTDYMAKGDLTHLIDGNYQGEFAALKANVNHAVTQMQAILKIIVTNTEHVSVGAIQTVEAANHVAEQSAGQMSSLDEIASAVVESSSAVGQIAENAEQGGQLAKNTAELATTGRAQLAKLVEIIEQIAVEYNRIEQITGKITRIADKTHLLSLNAGLEAVRAGEHGLGFGFVAQQIGKLAEEASLSARDIGSLIASSSQSVVLGVNTAQQTQNAIESIAKSAQESGGAVQAISAAIVQQSAAIGWVSEQVNKIQSTGQANAAAAEEISATMKQLSDSVQQTYSQVQKFRLA